MASPSFAAPPRVREHFDAPRNVGSFASETPGVVTGHAGNAAHGALLRLQLLVDGERIRDTRFKAFGCGYSIACGSLLSELVKGSTLAEARALGPQALIDRLELPADKRYTAELALEALEAALQAHSRQ